MKWEIWISKVTLKQQNCVIQIPYAFNSIHALFSVLLSEKLLYVTVIEN